MGQGNKPWFTGRGPFSKINKFTTELRMLEAVVVYGLGGDSLINEMGGQGRENPFPDDSELTSELTVDSVIEKGRR